MIRTGEILVCADCGEELERLSTGDESWRWCEACQQVEGDFGSRTAGRDGWWRMKRYAGSVSDSFAGRAGDIVWWNGAEWTVLWFEPAHFSTHARIQRGTTILTKPLDELRFIRRGDDE